MIRILILTLSLTTGVSAQAAGLCRSLVSPRPSEVGRVVDRYTDAQLKEKISDIGFLKRVVEELDIQFKQESRALKKKILESEAELEFDAIIVGAGPHGVQAATALAGKNVLVLEAAPFVNNTFRRMGDAQPLNSGEYGTMGSSNDRPGAFFQVHDMVYLGYPLGTHNRAADVLQMKRNKSAGTQLLLETKANAWEVFESGGGLFVRIYLSNGKTVRAKFMAETVGLGVPRLQFEDAATTALVQRYFQSKDVTRMLPIMSYEGVMERMNTIRSYGRDPREDFKNDHVVIVGGGDGGNVTIEDVFGFGPGMLYLFPARKFPMSVTWVGQKEDTPEKIGKYDRYIGNMQKVFSPADGINKVIAPPTLDGRYVEKIEMENRNGKHVVKVYPKGGGDPIVGDYVILATGYTLTQVTVKGADPMKLEDRPLLIDGNPKAQQVHYDGQAWPVFRMGAQLGPKFATEQDIKDSSTGNPIGMNIMLPKTDAAARYIRAQIERK